MAACTITPRWLCSHHLGYLNANLNVRVQTEREEELLEILLLVMVLLLIRRKQRRVHILRDLRTNCTSDVYERMTFRAKCEKPVGYVLNEMELVNIENNTESTAH
jgi:hypothetical protein